MRGRGGQGGGDRPVSHYRLLFMLASEGEGMRRTRARLAGVASCRSACGWVVGWVVSEYLGCSRGGGGVWGLEADERADTGGSSYD